MSLTYEQVVKRNRRNPRRDYGLARRLARLEGHAARGLARDDFQLSLHEGANDWHQPGRSFGPSPLGPDHPKKNKVTDSDGNPRIVALSADQRIWRYKQAGGRLPSSPAMPLLEAAETPYDGREHARNLGITTRQRRRLVHKANRTSGYTARVERHEARARAGR
jgi:hypothetical protein